MWENNWTASLNHNTGIDDSTERIGFCYEAPWTIMGQLNVLHWIVVRIKRGKGEHWIGSNSSFTLYKEMILCLKEQTSHWERKILSLKQSSSLTEGEWYLSL